MLFLALAPLTAWGEDWTVDGKDYHDVVVDGVDAGLVSIHYDGGVGRLPLADLPPELQKRFNFVPTKTKLPDAPQVVEPTPTPDAPAPGTGDSEEQKAQALEIINSMEDIGHGGDHSAKALDDLESRIEDYEKEPINLATLRTNVLYMRKSQLGLLKVVDPPRYQALLQFLLTDTFPGVSGIAQEEKAVADRLARLKTQPISLSYKAIDGRDVDISKLRGKVVLIDFWASWCEPCRKEVPDLVAVYEKYHDRGFEIIGVSLDSDKDALTVYTQENGMLWPEYFDGKVWDNDLSKSFGISAVPAMWLVDKKGLLVTTDGRKDLAGQVEKLLQP
jgi:thiol-disulfide isomerase/thioredoxin